MKPTYFIAFLLVLTAAGLATAAKAQTAHRSPYVTNQVPGLQYAPEKAKSTPKAARGSETVNAQIKNGTFGGGKVSAGATGSSASAVKKAVPGIALVSDSPAKKDSVKAKPASFVVPSQGEEKTQAPKQ